uniref:Uncharacterized protein n=1 Tax=Setaria viridis TaxID=4556 RepID=A0A4U6VGZ5_SETVI|nr:hypothetical protein SEVIR_3G276250v2 [Setaria viridis]
MINKMITWPKPILHDTKPSLNKLGMINAPI